MKKGVKLKKSITKLAQERVRHAFVEGRFNVDLKKMREKAKKEFSLEDAKTYADEFEKKFTEKLKTTDKNHLIKLLGLTRGKDAAKRKSPLNKASLKTAAKKLFENKEEAKRYIEFYTQGFYERKAQNRDYVEDISSSSDETSETSFSESSSTLEHSSKNKSAATTALTQALNPAEKYHIPTNSLTSLMQNQALNQQDKQPHPFENLSLLNYFYQVAKMQANLATTSKADIPQSTKDKKLLRHSY